MPQRGQKAPALAVLLTGLLAHSMAAQVLYGSLIGTVAEPSAGAVPGRRHPS
jgi:hypothetical protein